MYSFRLSTVASLTLALTAFGCGEKETDDVGTDSAATVDSEPAPVVQDADGDGILDAHEGVEDADGDGLTNMEDTDSDGDGIPDSEEAGDNNINTLPYDTDEDGTPDYLDLDSDDNGVKDAKEAGDDPTNPRDFDGDGVYDFQDSDNDDDGILDVWEIGDDPNSPVNTDGEGRADYLDVDSDNDTLCDSYEGATSEYNPEPQDSDGDGVYDFRDTDSDDDGTLDSAEGQVSGSCGEPADTDGDGKFDSADTDSDGDGLGDAEEKESYGTDAYADDSDGDGQTDGAEIAAGTDPLDASSYIEGIYIEVPERTTKEQSFEFELRIQYGDIAFLTDTTCSMSSTLSATADRFSEIVDELADTFENVAFGFAQFDDYPFGSMGSSPDKAFILLQQVTTNESDMQKQLDKVQLHNGADGQESTIEALYQGITGAGHDLSCNKKYDAVYDVPPFIESSTDPFGGTQTGSYDSTVEGTGSKGGFGFRDYSLPVLVYATDIYMRDPDSSNASLAQVPGGCPMDAGSSDMVAALADLGGYIIGIDVGSYGPGSLYSPYDAMEVLSYSTNSLADLDEDGVDDPLVFYIPQGGASFGSELKEKIVKAVDQLVSSIQFSRIELKIEGDEYDMVRSIDPTYYENLDYEGITDLPFTLEFLGTVPATEDDQYFTMTLLVIGDGTVLLDSLDIVVVVPGTAN